MVPIDRVGLMSRSSAYGSATVDVDDLAGDVGGRRHTQERHHRRHLRRLPDATQWNPLTSVLHGLRVCYLLHMPNSETDYYGNKQPLNHMHGILELINLDRSLSWLMHNPHNLDFSISPSNIGLF